MSRYIASKKKKHSSVTDIRRCRETDIKNWRKCNWWK